MSQVLLFGRFGYVFLLLFAGAVLNIFVSPSDLTLAVVVLRKLVNFVTKLPGLSSLFLA